MAGVRITDRIRELSDARKRIEEVINKSTVRWYGHMKRMVKSVYES